MFFPRFIGPSDPEAAMTGVGAVQVSESLPAIAPDPSDTPLESDEPVVGTADATASSPWFPGYFLLAAMATTFAVVTDVGLANWDRYTFLANGMVRWWAAYLIWLILGWLPYGCAWGLRIMFRHSRVYDGGVMLLAAGSVVAYFLAASSVFGVWRVEKAFSGIFFGQLTILTALALGAALERWIGDE